MKDAELSMGSLGENLQMTVTCTISFLTLQHTAIGTVRDSKNMGRNFMSFFTFVQFYYFLCVYWQAFVGVDHHTKQAGICLKQKEKKMKYDNNKLWFVTVGKTSKLEPAATRLSKQKLKIRIWYNPF